MENYCRCHFMNCRGLKLDKKSMNLDSVLSDEFLLIDNMLLQQGSMTIHNQSSCHNYATHNLKKKKKKDVKTSWIEKGKAGKKRRQQRTHEITTLLLKPKETHLAQQ